MERARSLPTPQASSSACAVQVVASTWPRDSHELFDFEARHLHTKTFMCQQSVKCARVGNVVMMVGENEAMPMGSDLLLRLVQKDGAFWVDKGSSTESSRRLWLVVRDLAASGHRLAENDHIKLGRFKFRVRQIEPTGSGSCQPNLMLDVNDVMCHTDTERTEENQLRQCRICLLEGWTEEDPLITPCKCKGSIEFIHLGCLRHWVQGRLNLPEKASGSYFYRPLSCELCKAFYPAFVHVGSTRQPLVEVPWTAPPFIVLENLVRDSHQHNSRGLHVLSLADNKLLKLGRGHESDVRIADVSISRCHATIRFHKGHFVLEDHNSKFGTLVAMRRPRALDFGSIISIEAGRTVLSLTLLTAVPETGPEGDHQNCLSVHMPPSSARDERALRLSLLTRSLDSTPGSLLPSQETPGPISIRSLGSLVGSAVPVDHGPGPHSDWQTVDSASPRGTEEVMADSG